MKLLKQKWLFEVIGLLAVALLLWFVGPLVAVAGAVPLESAVSRSVTILVVALLWLGYAVWRHRHAQKREAQLLDGLSQDGETAAAGSQTDAELGVLKRGFEDAMAVLKSAAQKKRRGSQYLYELPWYVIVGTPGAGKTTALINSGLHFPLAERLGSHAVKGVSGTRDCDWWFADEAVLLDTAGRYTSQDSHREADASAWQGFLELLKKYRPRRPLNGILAAVSLSDLLQQNEEQLKQHAQLIRQRILELNAKLGVQLPVYMLLTKADLIAGFNDFFAGLTEDERAQVWGRTFTGWQDAGVSNNLAQFSADYDELVARLVQRRLKRIQEERDVQRRAAIFDFPMQVSLLKNPLLQFLDAAFSPNRYETPLFLRGVYFTSATQQGTPVDRVLSALAASYRLDRQSAALTGGRGKSFFLSRLLKQVIFPEAELTGTDPKVEKRFKAMRLGGYIAASAAVFAVMAGWLVSYNANQNALADVEQQIAAYRAVPNTPGSDALQAQLALLPRLNALQAAASVFPETGWYAGLGLYQGDQIEAGANTAYRHLLSQGFAPLLAQRLKERMQSAEGNNLEVLYQLLRVYLMFTQPEHLDEKTAKAWITLDWQNALATDPDAQSKLQTHLDNLLSQPLTPLAEDQTLVASVRSKLTQTPMAVQIYGQFKNEALFDRGHDLNIATELSPNGGRVYTAGGKPLETVQIPGLFTAYGFTDLFLKKGKDYVKQAGEQTWVLGNKPVDGQAENARLYGDFLRLYLADYQKQWDSLLAGLNIQPQQSNNQLIDTLDLLSRPDSPLKLLLQAIAKNTGLSGLAAASANPLEKAAAVAGAALPDAIGQQVLQQAKPAGADSDPVKDLEAHFEPYNQQVRMVADRPAPIDATLASLKNLHDYLLQASLSPDKKAGILPGGALSPIQTAKQDFARLPDTIAASLDNLTSAGGSQLKNDAKAQLSEFLKTSVAIPCNNALSGRYPFSPAAKQDVLMADFVKLFAANGLIDHYFNTNLKTLVDTAAVNWQEAGHENPLGLSPATLKQFQLAAKIRDSFFGAGGNPQVQFELKPLTLDDRVGTFRLNIEGQELVYQHGPEQVSQFKWPGTNPSAGVRLVFETLDGKQAGLTKEGTWALFKLLDEFNIQATPLPDRFTLTVQVEGYTASFELRAASVNNPFAFKDYRNFRCPEAL